MSEPTDDGILIEKDELRIALDTHHPVTGEKLEPEERPAQRVLTTHSEVSLHNQGSTGVGMKTEIIVEAPAIQFAQGVREMCSGCIHFNQPAWHALFRKKSATRDGQMELDAMRHGMVATQNAAMREQHEGNDGEIDVDHALLASGICEPLTETLKEPVIVYPMATCPTTLPDGQPFPKCYSPKTTEAERRGSAAFDAVMRAAQDKL